MNNLIAGFKDAHRHFGALLYACEAFILLALCIGVRTQSAALIIFAVGAFVVIARLAYDTDDLPQGEPTEFSTFWSEQQSIEAQRQAILKRARAWDAQAMAVRSDTLGGHAGGDL